MGCSHSQLLENREHSGTTKGLLRDEKPSWIAGKVVILSGLCRASGLLWIHLSTVQRPLSVHHSR